MKRRGVWIAVAGAGVAIVLAAGVFAFLRAKEFQSLAMAGKAEAKAALKSLEAKRPAAALAGFEKAGDEFGRARELLGPQWLHGVPWLGRQLSAANDLTTIGVEGSKAGAQASRLLGDALAHGGGLSELLRASRPRLDAALVSLVVVAERSRALSGDDLLPPLADAVTEAQNLLRGMEPLLGRSQAMLDLERHLFSGQHRFLVVAQNSSELRPTGGFMGTFGLMRFGPDGVALDSFADVYTLPLDTLDEPLPPGGQVNYRHFYFRNTNWWLDFPTSANMMLKFWTNLKQPAIDGIVAVDIPMLQELLKVYGPITVPESDQPITAANAMELLNEVVQYERSGQDDRKDRKLAIVSLVKELFARVGSLAPEDAQPTLEALATATNEKHIQVFFTDPGAQAAAVTVGWSGALAVSPDTTDLVAVSNGVIKPSKANIGVTKSLDYEVRLAGDGSADTTLTLGYAKSPKLYKGVPQQWLANYARVHRLPGVLPMPGGSEFESLQDATGLPTFGHYFRLDPGASAKVEFRSRVPDALRPAGAAGESSRYRLLLAKQADLVDTKATVTVAVPDGWRLVLAEARWRNSGGSVSMTTGSGSAALTVGLAEDLVVDVVLAPS